jgi:diguanylate cyclase (GGDEF)-like protein
MGVGLRKAGSAWSWPRWKMLLTASSLVIAIGFSAVYASIMRDIRRGDINLARQGLGNLASSLEVDIARNIEVYDLSLRATADNMVGQEINRLSEPARRLILFDRAATAKHFGRIQVFDTEGQLTIDASTLDPVPENCSDQEYFRVHRDRSDVGLFISRPMLRHSVYAIVLSRRITDTDGRFLGVVVGSIRFSFFHDLFGRLDLNPDDTISVLRRDGTLIMRKPFDFEAIGSNLRHVPGVMRALSEPSGSYSGRGVLDNVPRLIVWRDGTGPLVILAGKSWDDILRPWRNEAARIGAIMLGLILFVLASMLFLAREISRRTTAEAKLEELATTDALTGLNNRRKFDVAIEAEWRRAARLGIPLALLMLDADHFKSYNDSYGHQAGDEVLVGIAICIADSIRRAGDCAARYGGEEFSVLLPGLSSEEAFAVAEAIRFKVEKWSGDPIITTISVGVASLTPSPNMNWPELVSAADKALYAAKARGRNCSVLALAPTKASLAA